MADHKRDYASLEEEIASLEGASIIGTIHTLERDYPFYQVRQGKGKKKVILGGCVHGDEHSGVHAILAFFKGPAAAYLDSFEFIAYLCINPFGFEHDKRENGDDMNINREFKEGTACQEALLIMSSLESLAERYAFAMDFHETSADPTLNTFTAEDVDEPQGQIPGEFFLWETCPDKQKRLGALIVENIERAGLAVCKWPKIFEDTNSGGAIYYPEGCGTPCYASGGTLDGYMASRWAGQAFTIETVLEWPLEDRIRADLISLTTALDEELKR